MYSTFKFAIPPELSLGLSQPKKYKIENSGTHFDFK